MNDEPVFVRSMGGRGHHVYNRRNPVGRALFVITPFIAIGVLIGYYNSLHWSEGELDEAVHKGIKDVNQSRHYTTVDSDHSYLIGAAIRESGTGPGHGVDVARGDDGYTVSTEDTGTTYCVRITLTPEGTSRPATHIQFHRAHATVTDGSC